MIRSRRLHPDMISLMTSPEAAMCTSHNQGFETVRTDQDGNESISARKVPFRKQDELWLGRVAATANYELNAKHDYHLKENRRTNYEDMIAREPKIAVKDRVMNEFSTMIDESLDKILRKSLCNA